jgi:hypothetical protein
VPAWLSLFYSYVLIIVESSADGLLYREEQGSRSEIGCVGYGYFELNDPSLMIDLFLILCSLSSIKGMPWHIEGVSVHGGGFSTED